MKVYVVEDSALIRERLIAMLREIEDTEIVGESEEPGAALIGIHATRPDIVVLDLQLGNSSGLTVLRQLNDSMPTVIVLTNYATPPFRKQCFALGAKYFFDKTTEFSKVCETIKSLPR